jgi:hypothetical protein
VTVTIRGSEARESGGTLRQRFASLRDHLVDIVHGPQPSPGFMFSNRRCLLDYTKTSYTMSINI